MAAPNDTVTLVVRNVAWGGWKSVRVTRGVERCPSDFDLLVTEKFPSAANIDIRPFDSCQLYAGPDLLIDGYVDRYAAGFSTTGHNVRIMGRSRCEDIVDCSAVIAGAQISGASALALAQDLAAPYGIKVTSLAGAGPAIPLFNVELSETPYEIIERITRYAALLAYDGPDGNLILAQAGGGGAHSSGFQQGVNIQAADVTFTADERFSKYLAVLMTVDRLHDIGTQGNLIATVLDDTVPRFRQMVIASEQLVNGQSLAVARANWEKARRIGRSQALTCTVDTWRDSKGKLWTPNATAPVYVPKLKLAPKDSWVIGEVSFIEDAQGGKVADVTLMPPAAYQPEPNVLQLYDWQVSKALGGPAPTGITGR